MLQHSFLSRHEGLDPTLPGAPTRLGDRIPGQAPRICATERAGVMLEISIDDLGVRTSPDYRVASCVESLKKNRHRNGWLQRETCMCILHLDVRVRS